MSTKEELTSYSYSILKKVFPEISYCKSDGHKLTKDEFVDRLISFNAKLHPTNPKHLKGTVDLNAPSKTHEIKIQEKFQKLMETVEYSFPPQINAGDSQNYFMCPDVGLPKN